MRGLLAAIALAAACLALPAAGAARPDAGVAAQLERLAVPQELRVVSYYPSDAGWTRMWEPWRPERLASDLRRLRSLNANTVRIVVAPRAFGYPAPERRYLQRLDELIRIAARHRLQVQLTLFDWWGDYRDLAGSKQWAAAVLAPYVRDPRVAFVELRNELDPEDRDALAWARELVPWLRAFLARQTPVTISVAAEEPVRDLKTLAAALRGPSRPDFFTAHYFTGGGELALDVFRRLRRAAAPTPLWIGELGYPTSTTVSGYAGVPLTPSAQQAAQAHYLRVCFAAARRLGLPPPGVWILDDFAPGAIPTSDVSPREPEYAFGLFRVDGSAKRAAATLRGLFAGVRDTRFNGGFEQAVQAADGAALPAAWSVLPAWNLVVVRDPGRARTGRASVRLQSTAGAAGAGRVTIEPVEGAVRAGRRAEAAVWVSGRRATGTVKLALEWFDAEERRIGQSAARAPLPLGRGWTPLTASATPPPAAVFARVAVEVDNLQGTVWVDDAAFSWR